MKYVGGFMSPYGYITHSGTSGHIRVGGSRVRRWAKFKKAGVQTYPDTPYEPIPIVSSAIQEDTWFTVQAVAQTTQSGTIVTCLTAC